MTNDFRSFMKMASIAPVIEKQNGETTKDHWVSYLNF